MGSGGPPLSGEGVWEAGASGKRQAARPSLFVAQTECTGEAA